MATVHFIILAAGNGTRMKASLPKVLHPVGNFPMLGHVVRTCQTASQNIRQTKTHVVLSPQSEDIQTFLNTLNTRHTVVIQDQQQGTAHAVQCVCDVKNNHIQPDDRVVVLFGDTPLLSPETISSMTHALDHSDMVVAGMTPEDPKHYGRLVMNTQDHLEKIVEYKHANDVEKAIGLCNSGVMAFRADALLKGITLIPKQAGTGEYYLTDAVEVLNDHKKTISVVHIPVSEAEGVNTQQDLALAESRFQKQQRQRLMDQGVLLQDPQSVFFSYDTSIEPDVMVEPHVYFGPGTLVQAGAHIRAFSHIEGAIIGKHATVGPFARLRPGTNLGDHTRVGNFVEVKKTTLGSGSKINHLSYVGDTTIGQKSNIGAGTITCNYDGFSKHQTIIGNDVFVGSHSCLVAPVTLEDGAMTAAGSTITKSVPAGDLSVARTPQKNLSGKAVAFRDQKQNKE